MERMGQNQMFRLVRQVAAPDVTYAVSDCILLRLESPFLSREWLEQMGHLKY